MNIEINKITINKVKEFCQQKPYILRMRQSYSRLNDEQFYFAIDIMMKSQCYRFSEFDPDWITEDPNTFMQGYSYGILYSEVDREDD